MSKIGLKVTKISSGVQEILTINGGEWTRKVVDIRTDIKVLAGKALEEGADVLMLSFIPNGSLLTLFHTIAGRGGDLVSAWLFIPNDSHISADVEANLLQQVKTELAQSQVDDWRNLETLFSVEYPKKEAPFSFCESPQNNPCAVRYFGAGTDYELKELLGDRIYQTDYIDHKYIFLLDARSGIVASDKLPNYTNAPLREWVAVHPPHLPAGITMKLNGRDFASPQWAYKGQKLCLSVERMGFIPIPFQLTASEQPISIPPSLPWNVRVSTNSFCVADDEKHDITHSCRITLNGQRLDSAGTSLNEVEAMKARVVIHCSGYEEFNGTVNLLAGRMPVAITLGREKKTVIFMINNQECPNLKECPPQYYVNNEVQRNKVVYKYCVPDDAGGKWKKMAIIVAIAALLLGILIGAVGSYYWFSHSKKKEKTEIVKPAPNPSKGNIAPDKPSKTPPSPQKDVQVYKSLQPDLWRKADMDNEGLVGLFEDLKEVKINELTHKWKEKIDPTANPQWAQFLQQVEQLCSTSNAQNCAFTNLKNGYGTAKTAISIKTYLQKMKQDLSPASGTNSSTKTENSKSNPNQDTQNPL